MKLITRIAIRLTLALAPLMTLWAVLFYFTMIEEINDEMDDNLESYSETIIVRMLSHQELPPLNSGSNNSYSIKPVDPHYAAMHDGITYSDVEVYIPEREEYEPARVLTTIFEDVEGQHYELRVASPSFERDELAAAILQWLILIYFVLLATVIIITLIVLRRSMRPLYELLNWLDRYQPGHKHEDVPNDTTIPEFRQLNDAAQKAVERSEHLFEQQKSFIGNASHELQTPLAVIGNRIEWIIDNTNPTEKQIEQLVGINHSLAHIVKLNKTLLLLTKIDNGQFPEVSEVDIAALIRHETEIYDEIFEERNIKCNICGADSLVVEMNHILATTLIGNLVRNAYIHSPEGSQVDISINYDKLEIRNDGTEPLDAERVFNRFYRATKREGSTGLGLALVKAIGDYYSLSVEYRFENGKHIFSIFRPKKLN
jgi:signal transduction histidine kinase